MTPPATLPEFAHDGTLETVLMCERALNDFVAAGVRNRLFSLSPHKPYEPTSSEQYIYRVLKENLEAAKLAHFERLRRNHENFKNGTP